jgi:hypothetical protein
LSRQPIANRNARLRDATLWHTAQAFADPYIIADAFTCTALFVAGNECCLD